MQQLFLSTKPLAQDFGLLILRICMGAMMAFQHGLPKLESFEERKENFPELLGMDGTFTLAATIFAEFFCSFLLMLGLITRTALIFLAFTMVVAAFVIHADDPFGDKEMGLLYLASYVLLYLTGPGKYSLDKILLKK